MGGLSIPLQSSAMAGLLTPPGLVSKPSCSVMMRVELVKGGCRGVVVLPVSVCDGHCHGLVRVVLASFVSLLCTAYIEDTVPFFVGSSFPSDRRHRNVPPEYL